MRGSFFTKCKEILKLKHYAGKSIGLRTFITDLAVNSPDYILQKLAY
jgi:hypothetical protein